MAQRILKNNTASPVDITDTGYTVPASGQLVIPPQLYGLFEGSSDVVTYIGDSTLTVNDGTFDLSINEGTRLIQGGFSRPISDGSDPTIKAAVRVDTGTSYFDKRLLTENIIAGIDALGAFRRAATKVRSDGLTALCTDATVVVESTFGFDQQPDSFFRIINTGGAGTTWTIYIAGTSNDPSSPDRDVPSYSKVFTVEAGEVGDEISFRDRIIQELNADTTFRQSCFLKSQKATDRAVVHIFSEAFSASGEFYERPNPNDFMVTIGGSPGDGQVVVGFDNLISRSKPVTITRDFDSPHRLGLFGITGNVNVTPKELSDIFIEEAKNGGSPNMTVDGSGTPIDFYINASPSTDLFIETLIFNGSANGIKFGQFLAKNSALLNGIQISIKSDNIITTFPIIKATEDFKNKWAALSGSASNFAIDVQSGLDEIVAVLTFTNPFIIRVAGTFSIDDYIKVSIRDDLTSGLASLNFRAKGFEKEP